MGTCTILSWLKSTVLRWLQQDLCEAGNVTPMALVNSGHPQTVRTPATEDAIIAVVE